MRSDLEQITGVSDIDTNTDTQVCTFKLADKSVDIQAKLAELSKTNDHIAGFQIMP